VVGEAADIPVGGGLIVAKEKFVVTQPERGSCRAFSASCTYQGCPVNAISDGPIRCPFHNSAFDITDGSVLDGPATARLRNRLMDIRGDSVVITADA
jgi:nitrite reductase/ring-hydroxylating ferredoxin subunit